MIRPPGAAGPQPGRHRYFRAFAYKDYRPFWFGITLAYIGFWMQILAQGWLVLRLTDSPLMVGLIAAAGNLPFLLFALVGGAVTDRVNRRHLVIFTWTVTSFLMVALALLVFTDLIQLWHIFAIVLLSITLAALGTPARQALLPRFVPGEDLTSAVALWAASFHGSRVLGPLIGGVLVQHFGEGAAFSFYAFGSMAFAISMLFVHGGEPPPHPEKSWAVHREIWDGLSEVRKNKEAFALVVLTLLTALFGGAYLALLPVFARDVLGGTVLNLGTLMLSNGAGAVVSVVIISMTGNIRKKGTIILAGFALWGVSMILFSQSPTFTLAYLALGSIGFFWGVTETLSNVVLLALISPDYHGRVMSMLIGTWGMGFIGNTAAGGLAQAIGAPLAMAMVGVYIIVVTIGVFVVRPSLKDV